MARRRGWDLRAEGVLTLPIGGVTNLGAFIQVLGPCRGSASGWPVCAMPPRWHYARRALRTGRPGRQTSPSAGLEARGFFVCDADLEDELIRALGTPACRGRSSRRRASSTRFAGSRGSPPNGDAVLNAQLRRFLGTRARRKVRYGSLLIDAMALAHVPRALGLVIAHAREAARQAAR